MYINYNLKIRNRIVNLHKAKGYVFCDGSLRRYKNVIRNGKVLKKYKYTNTSVCALNYI